MRTPRAKAATGVEKPERLLCRSHHNMSNNRQTGRVGTKTLERAPLLMEDETERDAPSGVITVQTSPKELPTSNETVSVASRTSEKRLVRDAWSGIPVHA